MFTNRDSRNDLFTVFELLCTAYTESVISRNIISGFGKSFLWNSAKHDIEIDQVSQASFTSSSISEDSLSKLSSTRSKNLVNVKKKRRTGGPI